MRMKHAFRRLLCLLLSAAALLSLAACTSPLEEKLWEILTPTLVQGDLDALYLGEFNENYLDLTGASEEDCQSAYEQNLSLSADIFARCFGITNLTDDLRSEVEDLYREIYARAHYSVVGAVQIDETHYTVTVNVEPMDFFTPVLDGFDDAHGRLPFRLDRLCRRLPHDRRAVRRLRARLGAVRPRVVPPESRWHHIPPCPDR